MSRSQMAKVDDELLTISLVFYLLCSILLVFYNQEFESGAINYIKS